MSKGPGSLKVDIIIILLHFCEINVLYSDPFMHEVKFCRVKIERIYLQSSKVYIIFFNGSLISTLLSITVLFFLYIHRETAICKR